MVADERQPDTAEVILARLDQLQRGLCIVAFGVLIGVIFADVVARELTGAGLYWASQTGVWANVLVVMAGFGLASGSGAHLRPRFADSWLPASWAAQLGTLQHLCNALFCIAIGILAAGVVLETWRLGEIDIDLFLPVWPVQAALPVAFLLGGLRHFIYALVPRTRPGEVSALALGIQAEAERQDG